MLTKRTDGPSVTATEESYERVDGGGIQRSIAVEGTAHRVILRATDVRKERTGVHATVTIGIDSMVLEEDTFNIGRREDRTRLGNSALKNPLIGDLKDRLALFLDHELLLFLRGLWEFDVGKHAPMRRGGVIKRVSPPFLLAPYVLRNAGTILFGPPGRGKSWIAYSLAVMVDSGNSFFYGLEQAPAMIVNLERSEISVDARLGDINECLGLPRERELLRLDKRGRKFADVAESVRRVVEAEGVGLVVLDSLSRAGYGDLNDNEDTNRGMDALNGLGCAWLAIGHTPRGDEGHLFGSQMQDAAADIMVALASEERIDRSTSAAGKITLGIGLKGVKANDVRTPPLSILAFEFDEVGLSGIRKPRPAEFLTLENAAVVEDTRGQVKAYLASEGKASPSAISRDLGIPRTSVQSILTRGEEFAVVDQSGRTTLYGLAEDDVTQTRRNVTHASDGDINLTGGEEGPIVDLTDFTTNTHPPQFYAYGEPGAESFALAGASLAEKPTPPSQVESEGADATHASHSEHVASHRASRRAVRDPEDDPGYVDSLLGL